MACSASDRPPLGRVAILGLGLMGGSLGMALRARSAASEVVGWNRSQEPGRRALAAGAVDRVAASPEEAARDADVVVVAVPVERIVELARRAAAAMPTSGVVTDLGSVKARVVAEASGALQGRFVGGHPMAGSEESGITAAYADLYEGATWVLTPTDDSAPAAIDTVRGLAIAVGALPVVLSPEVHDRWVAAVSHLPHVAAYALAATAHEMAGTEGVQIAAGSYRDGTRVALSDPALWAGILLENRDAALAAMERYGAWLAGAAGALRRGERDGLERLLRGAHEARPRCEP
ncbi:MAG TPA: prephenate dehydrogenase/arogenate dehydrogenase family protein [Chthonomonadales bacterium]|nr:prephenate dehydrogenase/arogenate dehydrogenase family protein [Chthonomonadales bacterium]